MRLHALILASCTACSLTAQSPAVELRYFTPVHASVGHVEDSPQPRARVRLGRIVADARLRDAIMHRDSAVELSPYETLLWSDPPDTYVRRAASHALFDNHPLEQAFGGDAPVLDIELVAFEELRRGTARSGRVDLQYVLHDARAVLARGEIEIEREAASGSIDAVVVAIGEALEASTDDLAVRVCAAIAPER